MVSPAFALFWIGTSVVLYTYVGYGLVIYLFSVMKGRPKLAEHQSDVNLPEVTLLVAAFNEENYIEEKIKNTLSLDYPSTKLKIFFVTDGSTDRTPEIIRQYSSVTL